MKLFQIVIYLAASGMFGCRHTQPYSEISPFLSLSIADFNNTGGADTIAEDGQVLIFDEFTRKYRYQDVNKGLYYTGKATVYTNANSPHTIMMKNGLIIRADEGPIVVTDKLHYSETPSAVRLIDNDYRP